MRFRSHVVFARAQPPLSEFLARYGQIGEVVAISQRTWFVLRRRYVVLPVLAQRVKFRIAFMAGDERFASHADPTRIAEALERELAQKAVIRAQKLEALGRITGGAPHYFEQQRDVSAHGSDSQS